MSESLSKDLVSQTWSRPFTPPASIPDAADIVIIGGGIVGISTAWFLSKQGISVVVCEKGHIAGEQSSRNWGWVRQQGRDVRELPMMIDSMRIWNGLEEEIGEDVGFTQGGCLFMAKSERRLESFREWLDVAREYELDTTVLTRTELAAQVQGSAIDWAGAMFTASDGRAEPHKATTAIARAAERAGANILSACAVRGIETEAGQVSAVVTEHGRIRTSTVLCAAGAWSSMFCRSLGISLPQLQVRGTVARTAPGPDVLNGNLFDKRIGIRRRQDGGYTVAHGAVLDHSITPATFRHCFKFLPALRQEINVLRIRIGKDFIDEWNTPKTWSLDEPSPFEEERILNPKPNERIVAEIRRNLGIVFPQLKNTEIVETWAGMVETTPDVVPIIDSSDSIPGFHIATGFSGHGFGIAPGAGKAVAAMLTGNEIGYDLRPLRLARFFDGSPICLDVAV